MSSALLELIPYETRNLERPAYRLTDGFLQNPSPQALRAALAAAERAAGNTGIFAQMRLPRTAMGAAGVLQECGFRFAELTLHPFTRLAHNPVLASFTNDPAAYLKHGRDKNRNICATVLSSDRSPEAAEIVQLARSSFSDDRFHADPLCSDRLANQRYVNWTREMLADPLVEFSVLRVEEKMVGFITRKADDLLLTASSGYADYFWLFALKNMQREGLEIAKTTITGWNPDVLNLYVRLGFKFRFPELAFHYWSEAAQSGG